MSERIMQFDWSFMDNAEVMAALDWAVERCGRLFDVVDADDVRQDALVWVALRPQLVEKAIETGNYRDLGQNIYSATRKAAMREARRVARHVQLEPDRQ